MRFLFLVLVFVFSVPTTWAQVQLRIGSLTLPATGQGSPFCVQIPIFLHDVSMDERGFNNLTFTVEISGDTHIIDGSVADPMLVAGGFTNLNGGIRNPPIDLENQDPGSYPSPTCTTIFNQATEGFGSVDYLPPVSLLVLWALNNNVDGLGYKQGFMIDLNFGIAGRSRQGEDLLMAVLEIPIVQNPGEAVLTISGVPNTTLPDANIFQYDPGNGIFLADDFDLTEAMGTLRFCPQTLASQPEDVTACPGDNASFSVNVTGVGPFGYQWYHNDVALAGEDAATLSLTNISFDDLGTYYCEITSPCATINTASAELSVGELTASVSPPGLALGLSTPTLSSSVACAVPTETYEWRNSNGDLVGDEADLILDPPPAESETYTFTVTDGEARSIQHTIPVLVNPLGLDLNGDGFNTIEDLHLVVPQWMGSAFDANGDGILNALDMLYINVGSLPE